MDAAADGDTTVALAGHTFRLNGFRRSFGTYKCLVGSSQDGKARRKGTIPRRYGMTPNNMERVNIIQSDNIH